MPLFTDGPASTIEDLAAQDSQLLNVASAEGIDLTVKLQLAQEAIGIELQGLLRDIGVPGIQYVVVTPALRLWHTYRTLETVYRDAYNNELNDRYAGKRDQFRELGVWARERLREIGVGVALRPTPRAGKPDVRAAAGTMPAALYYVLMTWVNDAGEEGFPGVVTTTQVTAVDGGFLVTPAAAPQGVTGWNMYTGTSPETVARQNAEPLDPGSPWLQAAAPASGPWPGPGQEPDYLHPLPRVLQRC